MMKTTYGADFPAPGSDGLSNRNRQRAKGKYLDMTDQSNRSNPDQFDIECEMAIKWILAPIDGDKAPIWASKLIKVFGSLANTLAADVDILTDALDGLAIPAQHLNQWHRTMVHAAKCEVRFGSIFDNWDGIIQYLKMEMGQLRVEQIRALFFDKGNSWIGDEILATGTITGVECYPREVARRAVVGYAYGAILVHNHPSGDARMSKEDVSITYAVQESCRAVGVYLYDHLVICRDTYSSFRADNPLWARSS
jgi:DNA repair protein RadC